MTQYPLQSIQAPSNAVSQRPTADPAGPSLAVPPGPISIRAPAPVPAAASAPSTDPSELRRDLEYYRARAIELDGQVFQMRTLLQSGKGFSELMSIESLLDALMAVCRERYDVSSSAVMLLDDLDPTNIFYRVRAYYGLSDTFVDAVGNEEEMLLFRVPHDHGLLWQVVHQGDVFSVRDMAGQPRFKTAFRRWSLEVLGSETWVPLIRRGQVLGVMVLGACADGTPIPESEYPFLQEIAAVAATNVDSTLKYEKNARILANLRTLYDVNQQLANVNDFKQLTIETLSSAVHALKAQKANLMLYNAEKDCLEIKVVWGNIPRGVRDAINDGRMETKSFAIGEGVAGRAVQTRHPVRLNDRTKIPQVGRNVVYCILAAPLMHGPEVVGCITLTNKVTADDEGNTVLDPLGRFGEDDEQLLLGLADQASVNLHKARLYSAAITDRLTGLYNARHFETTFQGALDSARESGSTVSLAVVDIDRFKSFNDTHGHKAGDRVLAETARLLSDAVRDSSTDTCFRYGGEELCLLMRETDEETAASIVEEYRGRVEAHAVEYEGKKLKVTVSAGIASFPAHGDDRTVVFEKADGALYAAKSNGRNRVERATGATPTSRSQRAASDISPARGC